jgi:hypothetical protein
MKAYNTSINIGKSKYVVSYHDGIKKHDDGSPFFDIKIFKRIDNWRKFVKDLEKNGYTYKLILE